MSSANRRRLAACGLALLAACGNYSNDDLAFLSAIPGKDQLHVLVPVAAGQALCSLGKAQVALDAQTQGNAFNAAVDGILAFVDLIRAVPPTSRDGDRRSWGPFADGKHPGVEFLISMVRQRGATPANDRFDYTFAARRGGDAWTFVLTGTFLGSQARHGTGTLLLSFDASWQLGIEDPGTPHGQLQVDYALSGDPRTLELQLLSGASGLGLQPQFGYAYAGYADGRAVFDFVSIDTSGNVFTVDARFTARGDGKAKVDVNTPSGLTGGLSECFDGEGCLSWLDDPFNLIKACPLGPCSLGSAAACPAGLP